MKNILKSFKSQAAILMLMLFLISINAEVAANNCNDPNSNDCWDIVWCDEFNGSSLDGSNWSQRLNGLGNPYNSTTQHCVDGDNVAVSNGNLIITGKRETVDCLNNFTNPKVNKTYYYTTGNIDTKGKFSQKYGRFEARVKFPKVKGFWGGFWVSPEQGEWPMGGEIDIAEYWGGYPNEFGTAIWFGEEKSNPKKDDAKYVYPSGSSADQFHVYALEWEPTELRFYINDEYIRTITKAETIADGSNWPFDSEFYVRLTMDVGTDKIPGNNGTWGGAPINDGAEFPVEMLVDYVRVYENIPNCTQSNTSCDQIQNGEFENGVADWEFYKHSSVNADWSVDQNGDAKIAIYNGSNAYWKLQLLQRGLNLEQGKTYHVKFWARASYNRNIQVRLSNNADNTEYDKKVIGIKTFWAEYEFDFPMNNASDANARLNFRLGGNSGLYVYLDDVVLEEVDCEEPTVSCAELVSNGSFDVNTNGFTLEQYSGTSGNWFWRHNSGQYAHIDINNGGNANWKVQLVQNGISLEQGKEYEISFRAKANSPRELYIETSNAAGSNYGGGSVDIGTIWADHSIPFTMNSASDINARLNFHVGGSTNKIRLDDISIKEAGCSVNASRLSQDLSNIHLDNSSAVLNVNSTINEFININIAEIDSPSGEVYLYDMQGRLLIQESFDQVNQLSIASNHLNNGIYILKVRIGFKTHSAKVIKH